MKTNGVQYYKKYQELILSHIVTESDIYANYSYISCVNWEIGKTPETHPKKLEFNIDKFETGLKKIDFNVNVIDNEINDMNYKKIALPSNELSKDEYSNIEKTRNSTGVD